MEAAKGGTYCAKIGDFLLDEMVMLEPLSKGKFVYWRAEGLQRPQNAIKFTISCLFETCKVTLKYERHPSTGNWKINKWERHHSHRIVTVTSSEAYRNSPDVKCFVSLYTADQVSRLLTKKLGKNAELTSRAIASPIAAKLIYSRQADILSYRRAKEILNHSMETVHSIGMATLDGCAELLGKAGHTADIHVASGTEMKGIRLKAAQLKFKQFQRAGSDTKEARFHGGVVNVSDIDYQARYYIFVVFVPNICIYFIQMAQMTTTADAAPCQGVIPQSCSTIF